MNKRHPWTIPMLLMLCFFIGIGLTFYTGAPGYAGSAMALIPLVMFFRALFRSRTVR